MFSKYASFVVLEAKRAGSGRLHPHTTARRTKIAHRADFDYEPKPGYLYVRSRAISSRCNDNFDEFPADEIRQSFRTFIGKPVFVNHANDNHKRARGVVVDAVLHEDINPDGSEDTWTEVLMEVDAVRFPKLADAIIKGHIDRTSMGTDVAYSVCSACGNRASTPLEYCKHIPKMKGQVLKRRLASGKTEEVLIREICHGLGFFENSLLVEDPADPTAYFLDVDTRGMEMAASRRTPSHGRTPSMPFSHRTEAAKQRHMQRVAARRQAGYGDYEYMLCPTCGLEFISNGRGSTIPAHPHATRGGACPGSGQQGRTATRRTAGLARDIAALPPGKHKVTVNGAEFVLYYDESPAMGDMGGPVEGDVTGEYEVFESDPERPWGGKEVIRQHVSPHGSSGMGNPQAKSYAAEQVARAMQDHARRMASRRTAGDDISGRTTVPPQVNTLEGQECPVCGSEEFDGDTCDVCGYEAPPEEFQDPDLSKAKDFDRTGPEQLEDPNATPQQNGPNVPEGTPGTEAAEPDPGEFEETPVDENGDPAEVEGEPDEEAVDEDGNPIEEEVADVDEALQQTPPEDEELLTEVNDVLREVKKVVAPEGEVPVRVQDEVRDSLDEIEEILQTVDMEEVAEEADGEGEGDEEDEGDGEDEDDDTPDFLTSDDEDEDEGDDEDDDDEDDDEDDDDDNPFAKGSGRRPVRSRRTPHQGVRTHSEESMPGSTLKALQENVRLLRQIAANQRVQQAQIDFIGRMAGVEQHLAKIKRRADADNPAQPVQEPASTSPTQTTEDARGNAGDSVTDPGASSETDVAADAQGDVTNPGAEVTDVGAGANEDVSAPIDGTQEQRPDEEMITRPQQDWRDGIDTEPAYPETGWTNNASKESRVVAALRLARLRISQGIADTDDDLGLSTKIAQSEMTDHDIQTEIATLDKVAKAAGHHRPAPTAPRPPRRLVPRTAGGGGDRSTPSMASVGSGNGNGNGVLTPPAPTGVTDDEFLFEG